MSRASRCWRVPGQPRTLGLSESSPRETTPTETIPLDKGGEFNEAALLGRGYDLQQRHDRQMGSIKGTGEYFGT